MITTSFEYKKGTNLFKRQSLFGFANPAGVNIDNYILYYGPNGQGWSGVGLFTDFDSNSSNNNLNSWLIANNQNYSIKIAILYRPAAVNNDLNELQTEILGAQSHGANWVLIDDALTGEDEGGGGQISDTTMNWICNLAHSHNMLVAVSEDCATVFNTPSNPTNCRMNNRWSFFQNVDIIMPYGYDRTLNELYQYYYWILSKGKKIVPWLGFHVFKKTRDWHPSNWYYQKGSNSGDPGYIELAQYFSWFGIVFYYWEGDVGLYLSQLNNYLHLYNYLLVPGDALLE